MLMFIFTSRVIDMKAKLVSTWKSAIRSVREIEWNFPTGVAVYRYIHISIFKNHDTQPWYAARERYAVSAQVIRLKLLVLDLQTNSPASATAHFKVMTVCVSGFGHKEIKIANKRVWATQRVRSDLGGLRKSAMHSSSIVQRSIVQKNASNSTKDCDVIMTACISGLSKRMHGRLQHAILSKS